MEKYRLQDLGLPSDVFMIARCLDPPSQQDLQRVMTVLADYLDRLAVVRKLMELEHQCPHSPMQGKLLEVEVLAEHRVAACSNIRSTWRAVPFEVWDEIFRCYLHAIRADPRGTLKDANRHATLAPFTLSKVCRVWQMAARCSPSVWADLDIPTDVDLDSGVPSLKARDADHIVSRLNLFKLAAKHASWSLTVSASSGGETAKTGDAGNKLRLPPFLQYHPSLVLVDHLCIIGPSSITLGDWKLPSASSVVALPSGQQAKSSFEDSLPQLPNLRKAVFIDIMSQGYFPGELPWAQLTHLLLGKDLSIGEMQWILRLCPSLRQACFWLGYSHTRPDRPWSNRVPTASTTSTLHHLTDLTILRYSSSTPAGISFDGLSLPALTSMSLFLCRDLSFSMSSLHACANLTSLTLVGAFFWQSGQFNIEYALDACPMLRNLAMVAPEEDLVALLKHLTHADGTAKAACLESLTLVDWAYRYICLRPAQSFLGSPLGLGYNSREASAAPTTFPFAILESFVAYPMRLTPDAKVVF
ncbi:hypothetical protein NMY22_g164 [Coprinellus aureogranulatus]|nr:hypothetical protein NMY22_g164 [Coprinellus aureogranulatus]